MRIGLKNQLFLIIFLFSPPSLVAQDVSCKPYRQYPSPGHPVAVIELHPADKNYPFQAELSTLKLILMEPGICEVVWTEEGWFRGNIFVFKSRSANFSHGDIITIERGRFK